MHIKLSYQKKVIVAKLKTIVIFIAKIYQKKFLKLLTGRDSLPSKKSWVGTTFPPPMYKKKMIMTKDMKCLITY